MRIISDLPQHQGWELDVPATEIEAVKKGWSFVGGGGGGIAVANAPDKVLPGSKPGHLKVVEFDDDFTVAKYNGPDGQPLNRYKGPSARPSI